MHLFSNLVPRLEWATVVLGQPACRTSCQVAPSSPPPVCQRVHVLCTGMQGHLVRDPVSSVCTLHALLCNASSTFSGQRGELTEILPGPWAQFTAQPGERGRKRNNSMKKTKGGLAKICPRSSATYNSFSSPNRPSDRYLCDFQRPHPFPSVG